jgi:hypothetical protein
MSTRSTIAIKQGDKVTAIYCHFDGYKEGVGATLDQYYQDADKVRQLMDLGNLSALSREIGDKQDFNNREEISEDWCLAYGRDRGETGQEARTFDSVADWVTNFNSGEEYYYLYTEGEGWEIANNYGDEVEFSRLKTGETANV